MTTHDPGEFRMIDKAALNIDQRNQISESHVQSIANHWSWTAIGMILVSEQADGTLLVLDGQQRKMAADKRSDIQNLPCLVFSKNVVEEA